MKTTKTLEITDIPDTACPTAFALAGELLGLEANGPDENPSSEAWARAGMCASVVLREASAGRISLPLLVALLADMIDPDHDTEARRAIIDEHVRVVDLPE